MVCRVFKPLSEARHQMGDLAEALTLDQVVDSNAVRGALGWTPTHDFAAELDLYLAAWMPASSSPSVQFLLAVAKID